MLRKGLAFLLIFMLSGTILTGCGEKSSEEKPSIKDSVTMIIKADISTMDPHNPSVLLSRIVYQNMYEPLLNYYKGEFTPVLCEGYTISEDGLKYTFKLKKGVKFHNGEEMKASDVAFSMLRAKSLPYMKAFTSYLSDAVVKDDYTVEISLTKPYVPFLLSVGSSINIVSEKAAKEYGDELKNKPVGTGPYKFVKWDAGQQIVLERFENWHQGQAPVKTAIFKVVGDLSSGVVALETGEADLVYDMPTVSIKSVSENPKLTLERVRTLGCGYLTLNLEKPPLNDVNLRMALNYAIDRKKIIDIAWDGNGIISNGIWSDDTVGYSDSGKPFEFNLEKAKEYLSQSSYKGQELTMKIGNESYKKQATLIQEDLRAVGIKIKIELMETNAWIQDMTKGNYEISAIVMTIQPDADLWTSVFHSDSVDKVLNFSRVRNKDIDAAFEKGRSIMDPQARVKNYETISRILKDEAVIAPLYFKVATPAYAKGLTIKQFYPDGYAYVKDMSWK